MASGILVVGLLLIGFGMLILALPELFAFLAAAVFFVAGGGQYDVTTTLDQVTDPLSQ